MAWCLEQSSKLDQEIFDALAEFFAQTLQRAEHIADEFAVPVFCMKAMHLLDESLAMKELGKRMHCDASFVTVIADALEQRGLAKRAPNPADRRIKNLVLTPHGLDLKDRMERALLGQMPWSGTLDAHEREVFLALLRKMTGAGSSTPTPPTGGERAGEVSDTLSTASQGAS